MSDAILVINAGSSSIKFALFGCDAVPGDQAALAGQIDGIGTSPHLRAKSADGRQLAERDLAISGNVDTQHAESLAQLLEWIDAHDDDFRLIAAGHRVVHGGTRYDAPVLLTPVAIEDLAALIPLAPLHQPHNLAAVRAIAASRPALPQVACFDTAFHHSQPPLAQLYGLPRALSAKGIRRYGFHGLSYEYIAERLPEHLGASANGRVIVAHLGNGASLCAMRARRSIATTMGFSALEGLLMGTRGGNLDPGVLLYLLDHEGLSAAALTDLLYKRSGLLGVSGISSDMRSLLASHESSAREAVDLFCYRIAREIGSAVAALQGLDALVFTGGIGEHAAVIRQRICRDAGWLGVTLDEAANTSNAVRISQPDSKIAVLVLPTNEEYMIARHSARLLSASGSC